MMTAASSLPAVVASGDPAIEVTDLVVRYGRRRAVNGLTLRVPRGSIYGLVGANGAGKTSTIKVLLGFRAPASGAARVLGYDIARQRVEINARIGFVSETNSLYANMTYRQLCAFFCATARRWNQAVVDRYAALFGLPTDQRVRRLSKGMKTQLALCLALGSEPELLILDEPTTGLDPVARRAFLGVLIDEVAASGKTVFFSSHILSDVEAVADRVGILRAGRLLVSDELDVLKQRHALVRLTYSTPPSDEALAALRRIPDVMRVEREDRSIRALVHGDVAAIVAALQTASTPATVDTTHLSLDDIFHLYMQEAHA